jgi:hypothetical protein
MEVVVVVAPGRVGFRAATSQEGLVGLVAPVEMGCLLALLVLQLQELVVEVVLVIPLLQAMFTLELVDPVEAVRLDKTVLVILGPPTPVVVVAPEELAAAQAVPALSSSSTQTLTPSATPAAA